MPPSDKFSVEVPNMVTLRKRDLEEIIKDLAKSNPNITFGIMCTNGKLTCFAGTSDENNIVLEGDNISTNIAMAVGHIRQTS